MQVLNKLKAFDAYPKVNDDFIKRTTSGGIITVGAGLIMFALFVSEVALYLRVETDTHLSVDNSPLTDDIMRQRLRIHFDVSFHRLSCSAVELDAMDVSGEHHLDIHDEHVHKTRLTREGKKMKKADEAKMRAAKLVEDHEVQDDNTTERCGSCYGAGPQPDSCCNTCEEVREAYRTKGWALGNPDRIAQCKREGVFNRIVEEQEQGEGCNVEGYVEVSKVAGNVHFAPGKSFFAGGRLIHDLSPFKSQEFNMTHTIHQLSFGEPFPKMKNPLDGERASGESYNTMYQYFLKVVPTDYTRLGGKKIHSNQFSTTKNAKAVNLAGGGMGLPGVFFFYEFSSIRITFNERSCTFLHFLTSMCAIVGGVFTVSGLLDSAWYHTEKLVHKKA
mmetsp:Transcript_4747/g.15669  ORF Transcript_4747/g.15669 Transcript_4747/m.15669 type:complete len:388 (+) Transcript_4747:124-1287(+)|eukprot:CAMPEP_0182852308 /NCGR_PEP_ID=MMETSP0034_2-20130328/95_1 /TAXON_ID=156128 /ORGANISM="Nephroselmis pyriformis, Strain CCMP717" /LENGTH=387 /DNA_ID=CAMNT_0024983011 /DNA_START=124 /DNA_END=1287 /DNA_ORIENTATION=-